MRRFSIGTSVLAMSLVFAAPAQADITKAVYVGTMSGNDEGNYLGFGGGNFTKFATMTFYFDSETFGSYLSTTDYLGGAAFKNLYGSAMDSPGKGFLTIGSYSSGFFGQPNASLNNNSSYTKTDGAGYVNYGYDEVNHTVYTAFDDGDGYYDYKTMNAYARSSNTAFLNDTDADTPEFYADDPLDMQDGLYGSFDFYNTGLDTYQRAYGSFTITSVTITNLTSTGPVPEPASWAMMVLGLGAVGGALRRQRRRPIGQLAQVQA